MTKEFIADYLEVSSLVLSKLDHAVLNDVVRLIVELRNSGGRLFILGVGGSAANASHAVNDFRKLAHIEAYAPTDNASELTARINDEGWETVFSNWLAGSRLNKNDVVMVFSVGGGDSKNSVSVNLIRALEYAKKRGSSTIGIVGRDGGETAKLADVCVIIPTESETLVTPLAESFQSLIWHLLVSHPQIQVAETKW